MASLLLRRHRLFVGCAPDPGRSSEDVPSAVWRKSSPVSGYGCHSIHAAPAAWTVRRAPANLISCPGPASWSVYGVQARSFSAISSRVWGNALPLTATVFTLGVVLYRYYDRKRLQRSINRLDTALSSVTKELSLLEGAFARTEKVLERMRD